MTPAIRLALVYRAPVTRQEAERAAERLMEGSDLALDVVVHDGDTDLDSIKVSGDHNGVILCLMAGADLAESMRLLREALGKVAIEADRLNSSFRPPELPDIAADLTRLAEKLVPESTRPPSRAVRRGRPSSSPPPGSTPHSIRSRKRRR